MPIFASGSAPPSRTRSLWSRFWSYVYSIPFHWGCRALFAVPARRSYADILTAEVLSTESLENRRRRERLLFYYLADLPNPDHYPWPHLESCPGLPDVSFRLRKDQPRSRRCWEVDCGNSLYMQTTTYTPGNRRCCECRLFDTVDQPLWIHDCTLIHLCGNYVCRRHCYFADCVDVPVVLCHKHKGYLSSRCTPFSSPDYIETVFANDHRPRTPREFDLFDP
eukprot:6479026-Amphidinium_carterae.4